MGAKSKEKIRKWVENGGRLICLGDSSEYAIEILDIPVANAVKGLKDATFHCPGSTLHINVDNSNPIAYGIPEKALALNWNSPAFKIAPNPSNDRYHVIASYAETNLLESGWLFGEEKLVGRIAALEAEVGKGLRGSDRVQVPAPLPDPRHIQAPIQ